MKKVQVKYVYKSLHATTRDHAGPANCRSVHRAPAGLALALCKNYVFLTDAPKVMEYTHEFEGKEAKLHALVSHHQLL